MSKKMNIAMPKPFLKWAGGKTQLISSIESSLPVNIRKEKFTYLEPFVGSGAILFWMLRTFPNLEKAVINDINSDLINTYRVIASNPKELISLLTELQSEYHSLKESKEKQTVFYKEKVKSYNTRSTSFVEQASLFIYLNKSGFNGIYRVNKSNGYNVPIGSNATPPICDKENILAVSEALQKVEILEGDYQQTLEHADNNSFFYFDPPYKPLSKTSSFNSYTKIDFNDDEQVRLQKFCEEIELKGHKWMLSNSDVKGKDENDTFFDDIYSNYNIARVEARRSVNSNGAKRGKLNELLITNYNYAQVLQTA